MGPFRIQPQGPIRAYQTYQIASPHDHKVKTACEQAGCLAWQYGWETKVDESTPLGTFQASYIRHESGRTFKEMRTADGLTVFRFERQQRCFAEHETFPEFYMVRAGDWRKHLGLIRRHTRPGDFVEDWGEHQQRVADQVEKG